MRTIRLKCGYCGLEFDKPINEYNRRMRKGRKEFFCNLTCSARKILVPHGKPRPENITPGSERDEFSPFRFFMKVVKQRKKHETSDLTLEYLKSLWEEQEGICPISGWNMRLCETTARQRFKLSPQDASLDRVDNKRGYVQGNVRFICAMANYARNAWSDADVVEFSEAVVKRKRTHSSLLESET